jgi:nucleoside-diphosphate-sugar epimerase
MNILVLGGTGAMGRPLVSMFSKENKVYVTSRKSHPSSENIEYILGDAKDLLFLGRILSENHYDAVVDFMVWSKEFEVVSKLLLDHTNQYVFISSARVYAQSDKAITEQTPRLLDVSEDKEYLSTNEYALAKAREEDILFHSGKRNFTIVRPTITYNRSRLQLGVLEKENWLYRALHGRSIVFSKDIASKLTTMTYGDDVATGIISLIGKEKALGEVFHITCPEALLWSEVLNIYLSVLEKHLGRRPRVILTEKSTNLKFKNRVYQVIYCRYFNRSFDNAKVGRFCNINDFSPPQIGLANCLEQFLENPVFQGIEWELEAVNDRVAGERTPLSEITSKRAKIYYLIYRYNLKFILPVLKLIRRVLR